MNSNIDRKKFAERFRVLRKERGYTQEEIAQELGVKRGTIAAWEAGHRTPELSKAYKAAEIFNISTDYLLGRTDDPNEKGTESWWYRDTPPTRVELEDFLKNAKIYFHGAPLDEEDKEDIITYLQVKWEREKRKREKEKQKQKGE